MSSKVPPSAAPPPAPGADPTPAPSTTDSPEVIATVWDRGKPEPVTEPQGRRVHLTRAEVIERFRVPAVTTNKRLLAGWAPTSFKSDYRNMENVEASYAVGFDVDGDGTQINDVVAALDGFAGFIYTTHSHTPEAHRLRAIVWTSRPISTSEYVRCWKYVARRLPTVGQAAKDAARLWFVPGIPPGGEYRLVELRGEPLDVEQALEQEPEEPPTPYGGLSARANAEGPSHGGGVLIQVFAARGWLGREIRTGKYAVCCPWAAEHTKGRDLDTSTVLYAPDASQEVGAFHCSHDHCVNRTLGDVLSRFSPDELELARAAAGVEPDDSAQDLGEAIRMFRSGASEEQVGEALRERATYRRKLAGRGELGGDYLRRTVSKARAIVASTPAPEWAGAIQTFVVVAKYRYEPEKSWLGKTELHRVRVTLATEDGELLEPRRYITLPLAGHHEGARKLFDATIGDIGPPEAWLTGERARLEAALVGRRLEVVMPAGPMRRMP